MPSYAVAVNVIVRFGPRLVPRIGLEITTDLIVDAIVKPTVLLGSSVDKPTSTVPDACGTAVGFVSGSTGNAVAVIVYVKTCSAGTALAESPTSRLSNVTVLGGVASEKSAGLTTVFDATTAPFRTTVTRIAFDAIGIRRDCFGQVTRKVIVPTLRVVPDPPFPPKRRFPAPHPDNGSTVIRARTVTLAASASGLSC